MSTWDYLNRLWDRVNAPAGRDQVAAADAVMPEALAGADVSALPAEGSRDWVAQSLGREATNGGTAEQQALAQSLGVGPRPSAAPT